MIGISRHHTSVSTESRQATLDQVPLPMQKLAQRLAMLGPGNYNIVLLWQSACQEPVWIIDKLGKTENAK